MRVSYYTKLAGTSFRQDALAKVKPGKTLMRAVAEPENEYDKYAVRIEALLSDGWELVGYIAKGKNKDIQAELLNGGIVSIECKDVTGGDKATLGCNIGVTYGEGDSAIDPADMRDMLTQEVAYGDDEIIFFDKEKHKAYDRDGHELVSGSNFEKMFRQEPQLQYAARALSKSTGVQSSDIMDLWEHNRDLSADLGTLVHEALDYYYKYNDAMRKIDENKEREHTAKNWMPDYLGDIVDKFVKASGITLAETEIRIKMGRRTGIVDNLARTDEGLTLNDYKIVKELKDVKYEGVGKELKYSLQQNFYRDILEDFGLRIDKMYLWQYDGEKWSRHELKRINVKDLYNGKIPQ